MISEITHFRTPKMFSMVQRLVRLQVDQMLVAHGPPTMAVSGHLFYTPDGPLLVLRLVLLRTSPQVHC